MRSRSRWDKSPRRPPSVRGPDLYRQIGLKSLPSASSAAYGDSVRDRVKKALAALPGGRAAGATFLIYHRVSGSSSDELDLSPASFRAQVHLLVDQPVVPIDEATNALRRGDSRHRVVLTFDDGFQDVYENAWPLLRRHQLPFTIYLTTAYVGGVLRWDGSTAREQGAPALTWNQLQEMRDSGLCTIANHTHTHVRPERLAEDELDRCSETISKHLGVQPRHFAYTWGVPVPRMEQALRERFVTSATGRLGRNLPDTDPARYLRVPVRRTDPIEFFRAKLRGNLLPERAYGALVSAAKRAGARA